MKQHRIDLLHGNIVTVLTRLAVPIMATALVQTAYNLTDMAWIGVVGSDAVAAVGAAGMYTWLSTGVVMLAKMGGQVMVAQSIGQRKGTGDSVWPGRHADDPDFIYSLWTGDSDLCCPADRLLSFEFR